MVESPAFARCPLCTSALACVEMGKVRRDNLQGGPTGKKAHHLSRVVRNFIASYCINVWFKSVPQDRQLPKTPTSGPPGSPRTRPPDRSCGSRGSWEVQSDWSDVSVMMELLRRQETQARRTARVGANSAR